MIIDFFPFNILIFNYFFRYETIETHAREFLALIILAIGRVYWYCQNSELSYLILLVVQFIIIIRTTVVIRWIRKSGQFLSCCSRSFKCTLPQFIQVNQMNSKIRNERKSSFWNLYPRNFWFLCHRHQLSGYDQFSHMSLPLISNFSSVRWFLKTTWGFFQYLHTVSHSSFHHHYLQKL